MKRLLFLGDSKKLLKGFSALAQRKLGFELRSIQEGEPASDFKPMPSVGLGVEEIRVWVESGTYRVIYLARRPAAVYVLHAFQKKTQATNQNDLAIARKRFASL